MSNLVGIIICILLCFGFVNYTLADEGMWVEMKNLNPGQLVRTEWNGIPIGILYREQKTIDGLRKKYETRQLKKHGSNILPLFRSLKPTYFVFIDSTPCSSCKLAYISVGENIGLIDKCTMEKYDFSGRSKLGVSLKIPPHKYVSETKIVFGEF